ncbi:hypothetical protein ZWY2020_001823 [Hordeum vulgare]|nr:hypothetical protein ZWY2020_001823 [Hordeum vulgare]
MFAAHQTAALDEGYYGFVATMDVYNFNLGTEQYTVGSMDLFDVGDGELASYSAIQIGWEVSPKMYGDSRTRLAALWTTDGFQETGCPNAQCGFQPEEGAPMTLGGVIETVSQPKGLKTTITVKILKDGEMGDWLVYYGLNQDEPALIGCFPKSLFTGGMANRAAGVRFGGYVQTQTTSLAPMGSGYRPMGDAPVSAAMSNIQIINRNGQASLLMQDSPTVITEPNIYGATPIANGRFFYGGPF